MVPGRCISQPFTWVNIDSATDVDIGMPIA